MSPTDAVTIATARCGRRFAGAAGSALLRYSQDGEVVLELWLVDEVEERLVGRTRQAAVAGMAVLALVVASAWPTRVHKGATVELRVRRGTGTGLVSVGGRVAARLDVLP